MPFQSEKQRRFLHANHPEIAKRWERDYANGGILDINESEEIISDDGNDIELTAYNAAFDEPTGVKSLFRAKEGGNVRLGPHTATDLLAKKNPDGTRSKYQPPSQGGGFANVGGGGQDHPDRGWQTYAIDPPTAPATGDGPADRHPEVYEDPDLPPQLGGESTVEDAIDRARTDFETRKAKLQNKIAWSLGSKVFLGFFAPLTIGLGDLKTATNVYDLIQIEKDYINILESAKTQYKDLTPNPHVDTAIQIIDQEILDLTQKPDDEDDPGPHDPLTIELLEEKKEEMEDWDPISWYGGLKDSIRARQAKYAMLKEKGIIQDLPIADESVTDITMQANRGGLANLFRVKNQY